MRFGLFAISAFAVVACSPEVSAGDFSANALSCSKRMCYGKGMFVYTLQKEDSCQTLVRKNLNFTNIRHVEVVNKPINGFSCAGARSGQSICYPGAKGQGPC